MLGAIPILLLIIGVIFLIVALVVLAARVL